MEYRKVAGPGSKAWFRCRKCGIDTLKIGEIYMLRDELWQLAIERGRVPGKPGFEGMLCIDCVEGRLGRRLVYEDFTCVWPQRRL
jgi:hypothetical protein